MRCSRSGPRPAARAAARLVENPQDLELRELAGVANGLSLAVVEVRRNGDDRLVDRLQCLFGDPANPLRIAAPICSRVNT